MSSNITERRKIFLKEIFEDPKNLVWGLNKISERPDSLDFLPLMMEMNVFSPDKNPRPIESKEKGFWKIPFWESLDYLVEASAKISIPEHKATGELILKILREITYFKDENGQPVDNFRTWYSASKILSNLPTELISIDDIGMIPLWLSGRFKDTLASRELGIRLLPKLLKSDSNEDSIKATKVIEHLTQIRFTKDPDSESEKESPSTAVESYLLKKIISNNKQLLAEKCGVPVITIFISRVNEIYSSNLRSSNSSIWRPAIEDHALNYDFYGAENDMVSGLRDILLIFSKVDPKKFEEIVRNLLDSETQILKRIAIYCIDQEFSILEKLFYSSLSINLFALPFLHEMYHLLKNHFQKFQDNAKSEVLNLIKQSTKSLDDKSEKVHLQWRWLHSIYGLGYQEADNFYLDLEKTYKLQKIDKYPDFLVYSEVRSGFGKSPYTESQLLSFDTDTLIVALNSFKETNSWDGPTKRALSDTFTNAVKQQPNRFITILPSFLKCDFTYIYSIIDAYKKLWEESKNNSTVAVQIDWDMAWEKLILFFQEILTPAFWTIQQPENSGSLTPSKSWIPTIIADALKEGMKDDAHAFSEKYLGMALNIIKILLEKVPSSARPNRDDAMFEAINTKKGRCLETFFNYALRSCRIEDKVFRNHDQAWATIKPILDKELALCTNSNFEFSTLCGCYIAQLMYLSYDWLYSNLDAIFPEKYSDNWDCAVQGLAYLTHPSDLIINLLKQKNIFKKAIEKNYPGKYVKEKITQIIGLSYLWGNEDINDPNSLISYLLNDLHDEELSELVHFFWTFRDHELEKWQVDLIKDLWKACVEKINTNVDEHASLLSDLSLLATFLDVITPEDETLLLKSAPFVELKYHTDFFLEYMDDLADSYPEAIGRVVLKTLDNHKPGIDFDDRYKNIITKLYNKNEKFLAYQILDKLTHLDGMPELFQKLNSKP